MISGTASRLLSDLEGEVGGDAAVHMQYARTTGIFTCGRVVLEAVVRDAVIFLQTPEKFVSRQCATSHHGEEQVNSNHCAAAIVVCLNFSPPEIATTINVTIPARSPHTRNKPLPAKPAHRARYSPASNRQASRTWATTSVRSSHG